MGTVVEVLAGKAEDYMRKNTEFPFCFLELFLPDRLFAEASRLTSWRGSFTVIAL